MKCPIHSQTSTVQLLKFGNRKVMSLHILLLLGMWLFIHTGINYIMLVNGPLVAFQFYYNVNHRSMAIAMDAFLIILGVTELVIAIISAVICCGALSRRKVRRLHIQETASTVYWCVASKSKAPRNQYCMNNSFFWVGLSLSVYVQLWSFKEA